MSQRPGGRYRDALAHRDFRLLVVSFLVDAAGSWAYAVVISVEVYHRTHSTTWLAAVGASRWVTGLLLSAAAGVVADRYERTTVMLASALGSGIVMSAIAVSVGVRAPVWTLLVLIAVSAAVGSPYAPAAGALTPDVVGETDLAAANSLFSLSESLVVVLGPALGGLLLVVGSPTVGVAVNAASFFVAAAVVRRLQVRSRGDAEPGDGVLAPWLAGVRALTAHRVALVLVLFCALDAGVYGASSVLYVPLSVRLGTGLDGYSYLLAGNALGGVLAASLANRLSARPRLATVILASIVAQAAPFAVTAAVHSAGAAFGLQLVSGVGEVVVDVLALTAIQRELDGGVLSRVLGVFGALTTSATLIGSFTFSAVLQASGIGWALVAVGVVFPLLALVGLPALLRADRESAATAARVAPLVDLLARLDLFTGSPRPVLERLALRAEERQLPARAVVLSEGDAADALWVLVSGSLSVRVRGDASRGRQLPTVPAPGYVGELGLVHGVPRTATVRTREPSTLLRIDGAAFLDALETAPPTVAFTRLSSARWARTATRPAVSRR